MSELTTPSALPWDGGCRCERVRLRIGAPPIAAMACHCTGCQRMSASAFSLSLLVPEGGFEVTRGEPVIGGLHDADLQHFFCDFCLTWMFTRPRGMGFVNVRATMLDDARWFAPFAETYTSEMLPWASTGAVRRFERFPPMDGLAELSREFAEWARARGWPTPSGA